MDIPLAIRALTSLNLSSNHLKAKGAKIFVEAMKVTNYAIASFWHHFYSHLTTGSTAVVYCHPQDNGAVSSLNVSNNMVKGAGAKQIAKLLSKCEDGKPFRSKGIFASLVCKHCGQKKDGHTAGALAMLDLSRNEIPKKQQVAIAALCKSRGVDLSIAYQ